MRKTYDSQYFRNSSNDELQELYQKYRGMTDEKRPGCFDKYIIQYQSQTNFDAETEEAWGTVISFNSRLNYG